MAYSFCRLFSALNEHGIVDLPQMTRLECADLKNEMKYSKTSQKLFKLVQTLTQDMTEYSVGFKGDDLVCVQNSSVTDAC